MKKVFILLAFMLMAIAAKSRADDFSHYNIWTTSNIVTQQFGVKIQTGNIVLDHIEIISAGSADATFSVYDSPSSSDAFRRSWGPFSAASSRTVPFGIELSSGLIMSNIGATPANLIPFWKIKSRN